MPINEGEEAFTVYTHMFQSCRDIADHILETNRRVPAYFPKQPQLKCFQNNIATSDLFRARVNFFSNTKQIYLRILYSRK